MLLKDKNAVVYGAGGSVASGVARAFAREGARVFLAGHTLAKAEALAEEIAAAGGTAEAAEVDALEPQSVEGHLEEIVKTAGRIDITFNGISIRGDLQGTPLLEMPWEDFTTPVLVGVKTHFITATAAARHMVRQKSGVILTLSTSAAGLSGRDRRYHLTGGFSTACGAIETLTYSLAGELGPHGIRVVCLRPNAIPQAWARDHIESRIYMENGTALGRLPTLGEVGNAAVFMASDWASAMTGTVADLTCGSDMG
jgi:NAD(P)-dependent dehydrogenase (short-subunit alcohol dehydrogenase family)